MATAKRPPSGSYRVRVLDYTDAEKKKHYKSFTAATKKEAELMAAQYLNNREYQKPSDITVPDAVMRYIEAKEAVLSPATIAGYEGIRRRYIDGNDDLKNLTLSNLSNSALQIWVSNLSRKVSPKTVKNSFGLLAPALEMFAPDFRVKVTLPEGRRVDIDIPTEQEFQTIVSYLSQSEKEEAKELLIAVYLAAFGPMRRGEILALTSDDVSGNVITVNKDMVPDKNRIMVTKNTPKTQSGNRRIEYPQFVIDLLKDRNGRLVDITPDQLYGRWRRLLKTLGIKPYRFHALRHYGASYMSAIGISEKVILDRGGWASDIVMKRIYRHQISEESRKQTDKLMSHFEAFKPE